MNMGESTGNFVSPFEIDCGLLRISLGNGSPGGGRNGPMTGKAGTTFPFGAVGVLARSGISTPSCCTDIFLPLPEAGGPIGA